MQAFDSVLEKMIRNQIISRETGLAFATNAGNMELELADLPAGEMPQ